MDQQMGSAGGFANRRSIALWFLVLLSVAIIGWIFPQLRAIDGTLKDSSGSGILDLEFAFRAGKAAAIRDSWPISGEPPLRALARRSLKLDFGFILGYGLFYAALSLLAFYQVQPSARRIWRWLVAFPLVAAACDVLENLCLLTILGAEGRPAAWLPALASSAASLKFLLLAITILPLLVIGIVGLRCFLQMRLPAQADPNDFAQPEEVFAQEQRYIAKRRSKIKDLPAGFAESDRAIGMALSGGGIRSATTCLGALQALCERKILPKIDYLSTVSGGGYIGSALSSLLSINEKKIDISGSGDEEQYHFGNTDRAYFTTQAERFPFHPGPQAGRQAQFNGRIQLLYLRTHGDFLIVRRRLIHRDVLRAVGAVLGGIFYHLLVFLIWLVALAGLYLGVLHFMAGPLHITSFGAYVTELAQPLSRPSHPFWGALLLGAIFLPLAMWCISWLVWGPVLPDDWFRRGQESVEDNREYHSLWALFYLILLAAMVATWIGVRASRGSPDLSFILLPMGVYIGGWLMTVVLHALVTITPIFERNSRSRFAAWNGIFNYLAAASVLVVLFPYVIGWFAQSRLGLGGMGWLLSLAGTWLLRRRESEDGMAAPVKAAIAKLLASEALRKALLGLAVAGVIVLGFLWICAVIVQLETMRGHGDYLMFRFAIGGGFLALFVVLGFLLDFNKLSLHYFYRDRLVETYLQTFCPAPSAGVGRQDDQALERCRDNAEMPLSRLHGSFEAAPKMDAMQKVLEYCRRLAPSPGSAGADSGAAPGLPVKAATGAPYHLLVTCLNLTRSRDLKLRNRKSDAFIFSKLFCGSNTTGYVDTRKYRSGETKLARAMAISGAAVSPAIGSRTFFAQAFATSLFNVRLGQWMENPAYRGGASVYRRENLVFWPMYLLKEMLASTDATERLIYLSDGGHTGDNLGICPLLQRRCRLILAVDAECDPKRVFGSLNEAIRQIYIDELVDIDIDLEPIRPRGRSGLSKRHVAVGRIDYHEGDRGWLVVFKSTLTGDESEPIKNYQREHAIFPHQTTADQFFDDAQFESYRVLGWHLTTKAFESELQEALVERGWQNDWQQEFAQLES